MEASRSEANFSKLTTPENGGVGFRLRCEGNQKPVFFPRGNKGRGSSIPELRETMRNRKKQVWLWPNQAPLPQKNMWVRQEREASFWILKHRVTSET